MTRVVKHLACIAAIAHSIAAYDAAHAVLVDWDALSWTPGSTANSFDVDLGTAGNDVSITIGGNGNTLTNDIHTGALTPQIDASIAGGMSPVQNSLDIAANLHTISRVTISVDFSSLYLQGVSDVSFTIFDIDLGTNKDQIKNIYGIALDGSQVAATITNIGPAVGLTGTGLTQLLSGNVTVPDSGAGSADGNATISFGSTPITGFAFTFGNNAGAPRYQQIAIGDIYFTPVPEINPALCVAITCVSAAVLERRRRRHQTRVPA
jgi:hypothetical protein